MLLLGVQAPYIIHKITHSQALAIIIALGYGRVLTLSAFRKPPTLRPSCSGVVDHGLLGFRAPGHESACRARRLLHRTHRAARAIASIHSVNEARQGLYECKGSMPLPRGNSKNWNWQDPKLNCLLTHHRGLRGGTQFKSKCGQRRQTGHLKLCRITKANVWQLRWSSTFLGVPVQASQLHTVHHHRVETVQFVF